MKKLRIPLVSKAFYTWHYSKENNKNILLCCADEESAINLYKQLMFFTENAQSNDNVLHFPSLDTVPYDRVSPNTSILAQRANVLTKLINDPYYSRIIVTAAANLLLKVPPLETFADSILEISVGDQLDLRTINSFLVRNGFSRVASAVDSSEFAVRGEIIDIVTTNNQGYRVHFNWNQVESIRKYDVYSQISTSPVDKIVISLANEILINSDTTITFKNNFLQLFGVNHTTNPLYNSIMSGLKFHGYEHLMPLFYQKTASLFDYLGEHEIIYDNLCIQALLEYENTYQDFYQSRLASNKANPESFYLAMPPDRMISSSDNIKTMLLENNGILLEAGDHNNITRIPDLVRQAKADNKTEFDKLFEFVNANKTKTPIIFCQSKSNIERIKLLITNYNYSSLEVSNLLMAKKNYINICLVPLSGGFVYGNYLFISETEILGSKFTTHGHKSAKKKLQNILTELDNIIGGELIVHKEHGIGMFEKIQTMHVDGVAHDCLKIIYANNDILYLPVENIDQFKKYGSNEVVLDKLGSAGWQKRKARLKNRIKDIAAALIKISAQRQLATSTPVGFEQSLYDKFCQKFPYNETEDQLSAIKDVKTDLESGKLMDRLVCGDVGFGKTEVAMRAAFMIACDINQEGLQIALIAPTTILCKQHYRNFLERFEGMRLKIAQLSRLVKLTEAKKIKQELENGKINIIIGTHALLAANIKFCNLKMIIIDEEQHFGVTQKEHLKQLKAGVHVLSLSATPIPRTLQMSMVGIKDLSIIATPPIDRLPVRTNVLPYDAVIIRDALMRERFRGGLSFYVVPRIKDIEWVAKQLTKIVPDLKYRIAHGQMTPNEIDNVMNEFCDGKFDILLSTTIIESGIDIPIANTMIIHRADMLGLSQLYQLRGRVGRGKVRGYTYLTLNNKQTSKQSRKRLEVLQNIDSLGAGFTIASHDMDLRGFGNLIGDEQSGHIKEVGSELYQEMLDEEINNIKNKMESTVEFAPTINLSIPVLIPSEYIEDSSLRLAIYRRAGNLSSQEEIEEFYYEMENRFGSIPKEFNNLLQMVKIRNKCLELKIESLDSGPNGVVIKFNKHFDVADMVFVFIKKYPRQAKIKPDNKLVIIKTFQTESLIIEIENLLSDIEKCKN